jgi:hypothetical protein
MAGPSTSSSCLKSDAGKYSSLRCRITHFVVTYRYESGMYFHTKSEPKLPDKQTAALCFETDVPHVGSQHIPPRTFIFQIPWLLFVQAPPSFIENSVTPTPGISRTHPVQAHAAHGYKPLTRTSSLAQRPDRALLAGGLRVLAAPPQLPLVYPSRRVLGREADHHRAQLSAMARPGRL